MNCRQQTSVKDSFDFELQSRLHLDVITLLLSKGEVCLFSVGTYHPEEQYDELSDKVEHILRQRMISLIKDEKMLLLTLAFGIRIIEIFTKI